MAKKIVYDIVIESSDAQGSIKRVEDRLNELNQTANVSQKEINTLQQELKDLGQTNSDKAVEGVQSLRREYRRLTEELQRTEEGTEKFNELAQAAGQVKDRIDDAQDSIANFNKSPLENIRNNFSQLGQKIRALDFAGFNQSVKDLKTNLGNAATSFIGIQRGAGLAANGLKVFKVALAATGIGLLILAITTLISNFDTLKKSGGLIGAAFTVIGNIINAFTTSVLKLSDGLGLTSNAYQTYITKADESAEKTADLNLELEKLKEELDGVDFDSKINKQLKEYNQQLKELEKEKVKLTKLQTTFEIESREAAKLLKIQKELSSEREKSKEAGDFLTGTPLSGLLGVGGLAGDAALKNAIKNSEDAVKQSEINNKKVIKIEEDLAKKSAQVIELKNLRLRKIEKERSIENDANNKEAFNKQIGLLEEEQKRRLVILLQDFKNEEDLKIKVEQLDVEFLEKRKVITERFGNSTYDIEIALAQKAIAEKLRLEKEAEKNKPKFGVFAIGDEENKKLVEDTAQRQIGILSKETEQRAALRAVTLEGTDLEIATIEKSLELNTQKLDILREYSLTDTEIYKDAINEKALLEAQLTQSIKEEQQKRAENEEKTLEDRKKANLQYASQILGSVGGLTSQIQSLTNQRYDNEKERAGDNQEALNKIAKEQFETNKAFGIVSAIINTSLAIMNIWANSPNPIVGGILTGVVAAIGAAEIATIASQEFEPGTSGSSYNPNAQGSQTMAASVNAMSPNVNFAAAGSGANVQTAGGGSPNSVQFTGSISVSEINNTQQLVSIYETGSILGGG